MTQLFTAFNECIPYSLHNQKALDDKLTSSLNIHIKRILFVKKKTSQEKNFERQPYSFNKLQLSRLKSSVSLHIYY